MQTSGLVYPLVLMSTLKPITIKEVPEFLSDKDFLSKIIKGSMFRLVFSSFKDVENKYYLSYMLENLNSQYDIPAFMRETFSSLDDPKIVDFINHPLKVLNVEDRAILLFENKPYTIDEFYKTVSDWKSDLKSEGLEI